MALRSVIRHDIERMVRLCCQGILRPVNRWANGQPMMAVGRFTRSPKQSQKLNKRCYLNRDTMPPGRIPEFVSASLSGLVCARLLSLYWPRATHTGYCIADRWSRKFESVLGRIDHFTVCRSNVSLSRRLACIGWPNPKGWLVPAYCMSTSYRLLFVNLLGTNDRASV